MQQDVTQSKKLKPRDHGSGFSLAVSSPYDYVKVQLGHNKVSRP